MKRNFPRRLFPLAIGVFLLFPGCGNAAGSSAVEDVQETESISLAGEKDPETDSSCFDKDASLESRKQTIMVYMVGSSLESQMGAATVDLREMAKSGYDPDELNLIICAGGAWRWQNSAVSSSGLSIYRVLGGDLQKVSEMENENMGDPATLTEFLNFTLKHYPSDSCSLLFWDHGGGAVLGYGADEMYGYDMLTLPELERGLANSDLSGKKKLDWIGFDACMMGMLEVADILSPYSDYLIASEETEAEDGWDYSVLGDICEQNAFDGKSAGMLIEDAFAEYYEKGDNYGYIPDYTLSCIDLEKTAQVVSALEGMAAAASDRLDEKGMASLVRIRDHTKTFGKISDEDFYDYVDLYALAQSMQDLYPDEAAALQNAVLDAVVCNATNVPSARGLSVYFPYNNSEYKEEWLLEYRNICPGSIYYSFINRFSEVIDAIPSMQWDLSTNTPSGDADGSAYTVQLSEEQAASFASAATSIWSADDKDTYICWLNSRDVKLAGNVLSTGWDGRLFYLTDDSGDRYPVCAVEVERSEDYVEYAIPVMLNGLTVSAYIHVKVDDACPSGKISGIYHTLNASEEEGLYPDKTLIHIKDGDEVAPFYFARDIRFSDDHSIVPFEEWENTSGAGSAFTVKGNLEATLDITEEEQDYLCLFRISDMQGNRYFTDYLEIRR